MASDDDLKLNAQLTIPAWELQEAFVQASGPGGQNVNKVATAVQLRWNLEASSLPASVKARLRERLAHRLTNDGDILIEASEHRRQSHNRKAARDRLARLLAEAARPRKRRRKTRPTYGSIQRRLKAKKRRGEIKALRGAVKPDE